jgi:hypothetical protein
MVRVILRLSLLAALVLASAIGTNGNNLQLAAAQPEVVPTPPAEPQRTAVYAPRPQYDPIRAAEEAAERAEMAARAAIGRQMALVAAAPLYSPSIVFPYRYPTPVVPLAYGPPRAVRRAQRSLDRAGVPYAVYVPAVPWAARLSIAAPLPPPVQQPLGHEKIWTGPNGYIYRPWYGQPPAEAQGSAAPAAEPVPTPAPPDGPDARRLPVIPQLQEPPVLPAPPDARPHQPNPAPEPIPAPPPATGPQEF